MAKKPSKRTQTKAKPTVSQAKVPEINDPEEQLLRAATIHLIRKHGGLLVATDLRREQVDGSQRWVITVTLRYPTGHEGYVGDLLYDGRAFTFLTENSVRDQRIQQIAADPEGIRLWNEYRDSTLRAGKA